MVKIVICGAGIAGLSAYLLLEQHLKPTGREAHEIKIYEAYDVHSVNSKSTNDSSQELAADEPVFTPQAIGSAIGISRNGLNVLSRIKLTRSSSNGADTIRRGGTGKSGLESGLIKEMARHGHPIERWEISTARGWMIADVNLIPRHLRDTNQGATANDAKCFKSPAAAVTKDPYMYHSVMIARQACWEILRDRVLAHSTEAIVRKKVVGVVIGDERTRNIVRFEDGTEDTADLVIGADGLRSVVRKAMFESKDDPSPLPLTGQSNHVGPQGWLRAILRWLGASSEAGQDRTGPDYITPQYEGLVGVGGFVPSSILEAVGHKPGSMSVVFGPNGFFGYGYLTSTAAHDESPAEVDDSKNGSLSGATGAISTDSPRPSIVPPTAQPGPLAGWWSTFSSTTPYPYALSDAQQGSNKPQAFNKALAVQALVARHRTWKNPAISAIVAYISSSSSSSPATATTPPYPVSDSKALDASYPTWTTRELPHWTAGSRAVLIGDAAHALQPSSGQGACQALEDAEALARLLGHHVRSGLGAGADASMAAFPALETALAQYEALRMPRVHAVYERSQKMSRLKGDMGFVLEWTMYLMIYVMTWFRDDYNEKLFEYDLPSEVERVIKHGQRGPNI